MSDILIKNVKMPKNCEGCKLIPGYCKHRNIYCMDDNQKKFIRPKDCPLVEVPTPHGDLIDRDAIPYIFGSTHAAEYDTVTKFVINKMPTIIGAEAHE